MRAIILSNICGVGISYWKHSFLLSFYALFLNSGLSKVSQTLAILCYSADFSPLPCRLQTLLATHGIPTQTQKQVEPIKIRPPGDILMRVYARLGENGKLGLTGRPKRPLGALATSRVRLVCFVGK